MEELLIGLIGIVSYIAGGGTVTIWRLWRHRVYLTTGTEGWYAQRHRLRVAELGRQAVRNRLARDRAAERGD